ASLLPPGEGQDEGIENQSDIRNIFPNCVGCRSGQSHYVDLMGPVEIPTQSQKAAGIRMTHFMIVV
ncbi:MAG: hypothetical protein P8179_10015, partial [Candidatus Thiodiazotropha sp.]